MDSERIIEAAARQESLDCKYGHDDAMLDLKALQEDACCKKCELRACDLAAYIERIESERDEAHRTAGKALEEVRLEREVHVKATELLKDKARKLEAERDYYKSRLMAHECSDIHEVLAVNERLIVERDGWKRVAKSFPTDDLKALVRTAHDECATFDPNSLTGRVLVSARLLTPAILEWAGVE